MFGVIGWRLVLSLLNNCLFDDLHLDTLNSVLERWRESIVVQFFVVGGQTPRLSRHALEVTPEDQRHVVLEHKQMEVGSVISILKLLPDANPEETYLDSQNDYVGEQ